MKDYRKILITGGTGFFGYNLYQHLRRIDPDLDLWVFSRRTGADVKNYTQLEEAVAGKDLVLHLASQTHVDFSIEGDILEKQEFLNTNTLGTLNVLAACRKHKIKMIHMSTSEVYGSSQTPGVPMTEEHPVLAQAGVYAVSKAAADLLCRMAHMTEEQDVIIFRPFNMFGPHQSMEKLIPRFISLASFGEPLTVYGDGLQTRDYVWVQDVADALWRSRLLPAGTIVNCGTEATYTINDIAEIIIRACGSKGMKVHLTNTHARPGEVRELNGSYQKLYNLTGWKPVVRLEEGINRCVNWYTSNNYIVPPKILNRG